MRRRQIARDRLIGLGPRDARDATHGALNEMIGATARSSRVGAARLQKGVENDVQPAPV